MQATIHHHTVTRTQSKHAHTMLDNPWQVLATTCVVCTGYSLAAEATRIFTRKTAETGFAVATLHSATHLLLDGKLSWAKMWHCRTLGMLYTCNVLFPLFASIAGCNTLSLLLLRSISPMLVGLIRWRTQSAWQRVAVALAALSAFLIGYRQVTSEGGHVLGIACAAAATIASCALTIMQERTKGGDLTLQDRMVHMHAWALLSLSPTVPWLVMPWLLSTPPWITLGLTLLQWLCSQAIAVAVERTDAAASQIAQTLRRILSVLLIGVMHAALQQKEDAAAGGVDMVQLYSLCLSIASAILYECTPLKVKPKML